MPRKGSGATSKLDADPRKELSFQSQVIGIAKVNGWSITLGHVLTEERTTPGQEEPSEFEHILKGLFRAPASGEPLKQFFLHRRSNTFTLAYHTHDSRHSQKGFPDLVLLHPDRQLLKVVELKRDGEYPKLEQRLWLAAFEAVARAAPHVIHVHLWRPADRAAIVLALGGLDPLTGRQA